MRVGMGVTVGLEHNFPHSHGNRNDLSLGL